MTNSNLFHTTNVKVEKIKSNPFNAVGSKSENKMSGPFKIIKCKIEKNNVPNTKPRPWLKAAERAYSKKDYLDTVEKLSQAEEFAKGNLDILNRCKGIRHDISMQFIDFAKDSFNNKYYDDVLPNINKAEKYSKHDSTIVKICRRTVLDMSHKLIDESEILLDDRKYNDALNTITYAEKFSLDYEMILDRCREVRSDILFKKSFYFGKKVYMFAFTILFIFAIAYVSYNSDKKNDGQMNKQLQTQTPYTNDENQFYQPHIQNKSQSEQPSQSKKSQSKTATSSSNTTTNIGNDREATNKFMTEINIYDRNIANLAKDVNAYAGKNKDFRNANSLINRAKTLTNDIKDTQNKLKNTKFNSDDIKYQIMTVLNSEIERADGMREGMQSSHDGGDWHTGFNKGHNANIQFKKENQILQRMLQ